jgi:heme oxygenase (biliverdin-producing, ferredoxin)
VGPFKGTGLERGEALVQDIQWFKETKSMGPLPDLEDGPGAKYVQYLTKIAESDIPAFLCHYYNTYFAHMSGGAMIGKSLSNKLLDGDQLEFYQYPGGANPKVLGKDVKASLDAVASSWSAEDRQRSVDETKMTFQYSGAVLHCIYGAE